jgi:hypothetical protein
MQLPFLWCEARAAQERLRNIFRESSKIDKEPTSNSPNDAGTRAPHRYVSVKRRLTTARVGDHRLGRITVNLPAPGTGVETEKSHKYSV